MVIYTTLFSILLPPLALFILPPLILHSGYPSNMDKANPSTFDNQVTSHRFAVFMLAGNLVSNPRVTFMTKSDFGVQIFDCISGP